MPPVISALRVDSVYALAAKPRYPIPLIRGWNRLEGRPRLVDFERSLAAEVRDPLWFLTRQWQFGEFRGEDAASPIDVAIGSRATSLSTLTIAESEAPYDPAVPLEARVEREPVPGDLTLHMQASRCLTRLLAARGLAAFLPKHAANWPLGRGAVAGQPTEESERLHDVGGAFLFDTFALLNSVRANTYAGVAAIMTPNPSERTQLLSAVTDLKDWFERAYGAPRTEPSAWRPDRLSYAFDCAASAGAARADFVAEAYDGGALDWFAFDMPSGEGAAIDDGSGPSSALSCLPTGINFAGMPSPRFWEMENGRTEFGHIDANTNDLAKLLLTEFVLMFSNDWCVVPLELDIGSFVRVDGVLVTDVFGEQTLVRAANRGAGADWHKWSMYLLSGDESESPGLLLAPTLASAMHAPPLERVDFIRDEMANMVWAIEQRVASRLGDGMAGEPPSPAGAVPAAAAEMTKYVLGTSVPEPWRPFVPVHVPGSLRSIRLQRGRLPGPLRTPRAEILRVTGKYFIEEEEVPRAGRIVTRGFQRARWHDGRTFLWLGRRSQTGRGEGSSGLVFDHIVERTERDLT